MPITATETTAAIRRPALSSAAAAFLAKKHQMLIDGKWVDARSGETFAVEDPATEEIIAHVPAGDKADIDLAVAAARRAFETGPWSRISPAARQRLVWSLGDLLSAMPMNLPNWKRSTTASRSPTLAATMSAAPLRCSVIWRDGRRG